MNDDVMYTYDYDRIEYGLENLLKDKTFIEVDENEDKRVCVKIEDVFNFINSVDKDILDEEKEILLNELGIYVSVKYEIDRTIWDSDNILLFK